MGDVQPWLGPVSEAVQAGTSLAALAFSIRNFREHAVVRWAELVEGLAGTDTGELSRRLADDRELCAVVSIAVEHAARTTTDEKRWVLARIVAAVFRGEVDDAEIDPTPLLLRAVGALDGPHIRLLSIMALPRPGKGQLAESMLSGSWTVIDLSSRWPGGGDLVRPLLAVLEGENLIENVGTGTWDNVSAWNVSDFGRRLLRFLPDINPQHLLQAALRVFYLSDTFLAVRNIGPGIAHDMTVKVWNETDEANLTGETPIVVGDVGAGRNWRPDHWPSMIPRDDLAKSNSYRVRVQWADGDGVHAQDWRFPERWRSELLEDDDTLRAP